MRDIRSHRALLHYQFLAELKSSHVNTLLGQVWWLLEPVLSMAIYVVLLGMILRAGKEHYAIFILSGILPWHWHAKSTSQSAGSLVRAAGLIRALNFPRCVMVFTPLLSNGVHAAVALGLLVAAMPVFYEFPSWHVVLVPALFVCQGIFTLALGVLLAIANVFVRDVQKMLEPGLRAWYFLSPALYDIQDIPRHLQSLAYLNPFAAYLPAFRDVLMYHRLPNLTPLLIWTGVSLVFLHFALALFYRAEGRIARVL